MEREETVRMVLLSPGMLPTGVEVHKEGNGEMEDEDDKLLLSKPVPESEIKL